MKLTDLKKGEAATVAAVPYPRMEELGLIPGTTVILLSKGPFGEPLEIGFGGSTLLLDRQTAQKTEVEPCG